MLATPQTRPDFIVNIIEVYRTQLETSSLVPFQSLSNIFNISSANLFITEDPLDLSIEQILAVAASTKEDLQRQANRCILRNDMPRALGALCSIEAVDSFVYALKIRAGAQLGLPRRQRVFKPKGKS